jgi:hypothetical protein
VTSFSVSGSVRVPRDWRLSRRYEEFTPWEAAVAQHGPERTIPTDQKARNRLHHPVDPGWLQAPNVRDQPEPFRTIIALAIALVEPALRPQGPLGVVVFAAWSLAEDVGRVLARRQQDWISRLNKNRWLEPARVHRCDAHGWTLQRPSPHRAVEALVPLIPATASRPVNVGEQTSWCLTRTGRIPGWDKVRLVVSCEQASVMGRSVGLVTDRVDWSATQIIRLYGHRWPTETF